MRGAGGAPAVCSTRSGGKATYGLGPKALAFLGGVMHHAGEMAAMTNPTVNSYKRRAADQWRQWEPLSACSLLPAQIKRADDALRCHVVSQRCHVVGQ